MPAISVPDCLVRHSQARISENSLFGGPVCLLGRLLQTPTGFISAAYLGSTLPEYLSRSMYADGIRGGYPAIIHPVLAVLTANEINACLGQYVDPPAEVNEQAVKKKHVFYIREIRFHKSCETPFQPASILSCPITLDRKKSKYSKHHNTRLIVTAEWKDSTLDSTLGIGAKKQPSRWK